MNDDQGNSDMAESSAVGSRVLAFYEELPFNYRETVESSASAIRSQNSVAHYSVLPPLLLENTRVLELGCGTGWLSNGIAFHYGCQVTGIDFNPVAIERAEEVASALHLDSVWFQQADLFEFRGEAPYDLVVSMGVLHHTADCHGAIRRACNDFVRIGGHVMIGLYHAYGRRPFLDHFAQMRKDGAGEEEMLDRFRRLHGQLTDDTLVVSWFRDQVCHPHETQHTLKEVLPILHDCGMELVSTSINRFEEIDSTDKLFEQEKGYEAVASKRLRDGQYFPGFFVFLARKKP